MTGLHLDRIPTHPRLIFLGTPDFAVPSLRALVEAGYEVTALVTQPDRPRGRGKKKTPSPAKAFAQEQGIPVLQPEKASDRAFCESIRELEPDLLVVVAFGQVLRRNLLDVPKWGVINIHGSLLPRYRGAAPIQRAVLNNDNETGLTVMRMDEGLDTGGVLFQRTVPILPDETAGGLHDRMALLAGVFLVESLRHMAETAVEERPQDDALATYASKIQKEDCLIDWGEPAERVSARIRALDPQPGAYTTLEGKKVKLFSSRVSAARIPYGTPGRVRRDRENALVVEAGRGAVEIREIQYPGRKKLPAAAFLRGYSLPHGSFLGT